MDMQPIMRGCNRFDSGGGGRGVGYSRELYCFNFFAGQQGNDFSACHESVPRAFCKEKITPSNFVTNREKMVSLTLEKYTSNSAEN